MHVRSLFESLEKSVEVLDFAEQTLHLWRHILRLNNSFFAFISQCGNLNFFLQFSVKFRLWVSSIFSNPKLENYMNCQNGKMAILKTDNLSKVISRKILMEVKVIEFYTVTYVPLIVLASQRMWEWCTAVRMWEFWYSSNVLQIKSI